MSAARSSSRSEQLQLNVNGFDEAVLDRVVAAAEELISRKVECEQECLRFEEEIARRIEDDRLSRRHYGSLAVHNLRLTQTNKDLTRRCDILETENARHKGALSVLQNTARSAEKESTLRARENRNLALECESLQAELIRLRQESENQAELIRRMHASDNYAGRPLSRSTSWLDELSDKDYSTDSGAEADDEDSGDESDSDSSVEEEDSGYGSGSSSSDDTDEADSGYGSGGSSSDGIDEANSGYRSGSDSA